MDAIDCGEGHTSSRIGSLPAHLAGVVVINELGIPVDWVLLAEYADEGRVRGRVVFSVEMARKGDPCHLSF